jgi:UDP-GlcNAc3NAcA epimerase
VSTIRVMSVVGARPQFVKAAAVEEAIDRRNAFGSVIDHVTVHTGQHYDAQMSDVFFDELGLHPPEVHLGIGSATQGAQTGRMLEAVEGAITDLRPDVVLVHGDTNSTIAGALAAAKLGVPVAHVEAGMRSGRRDMPEEINRIVTDHVSTLLFCSTETAVAHLQREGITDGIVLTGDVMHAVLRRVDAHGDATVLDRLELDPGTYVVATVHRAHNVDDPVRLGLVVDSLAAVGERIPVILSAHPRLQRALGDRELPRGVRKIPPASYVEMIALQRHARAVVTDSGGMQKEALWLGVPCVTLREETEWPETLAGGWNVLAGVDPARVAEAVCRPPPSQTTKSALAITDAPDRIVDAVARLGASS